MTKWIGAAALAATLMFGCSAIDSAAAAPLRAAVQNPQTSNTTNEFSARRRLRHHPRYAQPYYLDRPNYYAPAPFVPFNFGYGLWPWW